MSSYFGFLKAGISSDRITENESLNSNLDERNSHEIDNDHENDKFNLLFKITSELKEVGLEINRALDEQNNDLKELEQKVDDRNIDIRRVNNKIDDLL